MNRLLDLPPVAPKPVGHRLQLTHDLAAVAGLFAHLAERRVRVGLAGRQRALGQRPHGLAAQIAGADQQDAALIVEDEATGGELESHAGSVAGHDLIIPTSDRVIPFRAAAQLLAPRAMPA